MLLLNDLDDYDDFPPWRNDQPTPSEWEVIVNFCLRAKIQVLSLRNSSTSYLPDSLARLHGLEELDLKNCSFGELPLVLAHMYWLNRIDMRRNLCYNNLDKSYPRGAEHTMHVIECCKARAEHEAIKQLLTVNVPKIASAIAPHIAVLPDSLAEERFWWPKKQTFYWQLEDQKERELAKVTRELEELRRKRQRITE